MRLSSIWSAAVTFALVALASLPAGGAAPAARLPAGLTLEEPCTDATLTKIVLVAGSNFFKPGQHEYIGGCAALMDLLRQTPDVFPVLALDWPKQPETF
ncbi:MAG TPA: hypothetical protein VG433_03875, partial [Pirellulales bacterium]|nr:hypothetical protein [Pirellulales bacterium]